MSAAVLRQFMPARWSIWWLGIAMGSSVVVAFALVQWPWLTSGLVFGLIILGVVLLEPLALVALMLAIGPIDLSFMTGGFKALFAAAGGIDMNGIRLIGITGGFIALAIAEPRVHRVAFSASGRWYMLFLVWAAASLVTSYSQIEGTRLLLKVAYPFLTFLVIAAFVETEEQLERLMRCALIAGAVIVVAINPLFVLSGNYTIDHEGFRRVRGVGAGENAFSFYLTIILLISFARFVVRAQWRYLLLCAASGFWIVLTLTRITTAALFVALLCMAIGAAIAARQYRATIAGALIAACLGTVLLPPVIKRTLGYVPTPGEFVSIARSPGTLYQAINWQGRQVLWPIVYNKFRSDPVTGLGIGSSTVVIRQNFPGVVQVAHNEYLRIAADTGLVGFGLFFLAMMAWLSVAVRSIARASPQMREFALAALGGIAAWAVIAITDNAFDYYGFFTQYVGFLVAGTVVAARLRQAQPTVEHA
jgi:O-antigen ligase